jgi:hypothetical protein
MKREMKGLNYFQLTIQEKLCIKQTAMNVHGKRVHWKRPDHCNKLNEIQLWSILSEYKDLLK